MKTAGMAGSFHRRWNTAPAGEVEGDVTAFLLENKEVVSAREVRYVYDNMLLNTHRTMQHFPDHEFSVSRSTRLVGGGSTKGMHT